MYFNLLYGLGPPYDLTFNKKLVNPSTLGVFNKQFNKNSHKSK